MFEELLAACPPPPHASLTRSYAWEELETRIGSVLPEDYKALVDTYGVGSFKDFLYIFQPTCPNAQLDIESMKKVIDNAFLALQEGGTLNLPTATENLVAVGATDNGDNIFLVKNGDTSPNSWNVMVTEKLGHQWFTHEGTLGGFLLSFVDDSLSIPFFPDSLRELPPHFEPVHFDSTKKDEPQSGISTQPLDAEDVREWARSNGYSVASQGRVPEKSLRHLSAPSSVLPELEPPDAENIWNRDSTLLSRSCSPKVKTTGLRSTISLPWPRSMQA